MSKLVRNIQTVVFKVIGFLNKPTDERDEIKFLNKVKVFHFLTFPYEEDINLTVLKIRRV